MFISFIIVSYNTKDRLKKCLTILKTELSKIQVDHEIIVVDNASSDETTEMLTAMGQIYIVNNTNLGFATACNQAAKQARGDILLFLNSDVEFNSELVFYLDKIFKTKEEIAIISPRLMSSDHKLEKTGYGRFPNLKRLLARNLSINYSGSEDNLEVDWVSGAVLSIRTSVFKKLSGFDEKFFMYFEDVDLCYRARLLGYKTVLLNNVTFIHDRGASLYNNQLRKKYYYQSQLHYFYKNNGRLKTFILLLLRLPLIFRYL